MKKKYLVMAAALCLSMMLFVGCGNNNSTDNRNNGIDTEATVSPTLPPEDVRDDGNSVLDDVGEGAKDVIDGAEDAVDGAADGTKRVIDGVTDDTGHDDGTDTNNSVTDGKRN